MEQNRPIRYGIPSMTNLPPELGRMIKEAFLNTPPFDSTKLERECARVNRQLARIASKVKKDETSTK